LIPPTLPMRPLISLMKGYGSTERVNDNETAGMID
jgi:hypothetical protein